MGDHRRREHASRHDLFGHRRGNEPVRRLRRRSRDPPVGRALGGRGRAWLGLLVSAARDDQAPVSAALESHARGLLDPDSLGLSLELRVGQFDTNLGQV
ncbi:MAG: hypothetical protein ABSC94_32340, partial [Polyangiaceae bacterium]